MTFDENPPSNRKIFDGIAPGNTWANIPNAVDEFGKPPAVDEFGKLPAYGDFDDPRDDEPSPPAPLFITDDEPLPAVAAPQPYVLGINTSQPFDFYEDVKSRIDGPTVESIMNDVKRYSWILQNLPTISTEAIVNELDQMSIVVPKESFDLSEIQALYSSLTAYRERAAQILREVEEYLEMVTVVSEELKKAAMCIATGNIPERQGYAAHLVLTFTHQQVIVKGLKDHVYRWIKGYESTQQALSNLLKHHEYFARLNMGAQQFGTGVRTTSNTQNFEDDSSARRRYNAG